MSGATLTIRETVEDDDDAVLALHRDAFGGDDVADLTRDLLDDPTARPRLSLIALAGDRPLGHVLFSRASVSGRDDLGVSILAPLAVAGDHQNRGIGSRLACDGLDRLRRTGTDLVFVLGHPDYYPRFGFRPAGRLGFPAPYPILEKNAGAWMVLAFRPGLVGTVSGAVGCAAALDKPEHWAE